MEFLEENMHEIILTEGFPDESAAQVIYNNSKGVPYIEAYYDDRDKKLYIKLLP